MLEITNMEKMIFGAVAFVLASSASAFAGCPQGWDVSAEPKKCLVEESAVQPIATFSITQWSKPENTVLNEAEFSGVDYPAKEGTSSFTQRVTNPGPRLGPTVMYRDRYGKAYYAEACHFQEGLFGEAELCVEKGLQVMAGLLNLSGVDNNRASYFEAQSKVTGLECRLELLEEQLNDADNGGKPELLEQVREMRGELPDIRQTLKDWKFWLDNPNDRTSG